MNTSTLRTGSLTALASLVLVGSGFLTTTAAASQSAEGGCCSLGASTEIDEVVAVRKMAAAQALVDRR